MIRVKYSISDYLNSTALLRTLLVRPVVYSSHVQYFNILPQEGH